MSAGNTPLHTAAVLGDAAAVNALLASGSRPDDVNTFGKLPEDVTSDPAICATLRGAACDPACLFNGDPVICFMFTFNSRTDCACAARAGGASIVESAGHPGENIVAVCSAAAARITLLFVAPV